MNYAEALNEYKDERTVREEALNYVNKIRTRAGIRTYTFGNSDAQNIHVDDNQEAVRKIIRAERRVELCGEGVRYDDLRQSGSLSQVRQHPHRQEMRIFVSQNL